MCKSIDAAITMVNRSIDRVETDDDRNYYMDFVKLHKLLFVAQCHAHNQYKTSLFEEEIEVHHCGPLVRGLDLIPGKCGFDLITWRLDAKSFGTVDMPLTYYRSKAIDDVLDKFGKFSTDKIVATVKNTPAFQKHLPCVNEHLPIPKEDLIQAGIDLFRD